MTFLEEVKKSEKFIYDELSTFSSFGVWMAVRDGLEIEQERERRKEQIKTLVFFLLAIGALLLLAGARRQCA